MKYKTRRISFSTTNKDNLRNVSAPLEALRFGFVLDAEMLRWTLRCVGLCTAEFPVTGKSLPAMLRRDRDDPDRDPSDSGCWLGLVG